MTIITSSPAEDFLFEKIGNYSNLIVWPKKQKPIKNYALALVLK